MEEWYSSHNQWRSVRLVTHSILQLYHIIVHVLFFNCMLLIQFVGTFDICNVSVTMLKLQQLCFTIEYIDGYKTPYTFLQLIYPTIGYVQNQVIDGTDGCINIQSVKSTLTCNLSATDIDAIKNVDTTPPVVITVTLTPESTSTSYPSIRISSTPSLLPTGEVENFLAAVFIIDYMYTTCNTMEVFQMQRKLGLQLLLVNF